MKFLAILKDSFLETVDRKIFYVLLVFSLILIIFCASLSHKDLPLDDVIRNAVRGFNHITVIKGFSVSEINMPAVEFEVGPLKDIPEPSNEDDISSEFSGGFEFDITVSPKEEFFSLVRKWDDAMKRRRRPSADDRASEVIPPPMDLRNAYLNTKFKEAGFTRTEAIQVDETETSLRFHVKSFPIRRDLIHGSQEIGILFGAWTVKSAGMSGLTLALIIQVSLVNAVAGWIGIIIALVVTSGFIPNMLAKGGIELLVSKPLSRPLLFLYKYVGGLIFVFILASFLLGGCWLALSIRMNYWNAWFLLTIPLITFFFAVLYSVSALFGLITRSSRTSMLMCLVFWFFCWVIEQARVLIKEFLPEEGTDIPAWTERGIEVLYTILPKLGDIKNLTGVLISKSGIPPDVLSSLNIAYGREIPWEFTILTSLGFTAVVLAAGCLIFTRRDY